MTREAQRFTGCTGLGVRIAIIDSGVHAMHSHILPGQIEEGVAVLRDGRIEPGNEATQDGLGHGTAVTAAVQEKAPDAICQPIRVFHESLKTTGMALITAIDWAVKQRADIINLSLGSTNPGHTSAFAEAVERACHAGAAIVAAYHVDNMPCYPGAIDGVIGVGIDWECPRDAFRFAGDESHFLASGYPRPIPGVPLRQNLYGISFAVAQMSGFAACALESMARDTPGPERIRALLATLGANAD